jgi:hypothetical protein
VNGQTVTIHVELSVLMPSSLRIRWCESSMITGWASRRGKR